MAVTLPSDLIADVMRNADPSRRQAATARLQSLGNQEQGEFAGLVDQVATSASIVREPAHPIVAFSPHRAARASDGEADNKADALRGFERMVLRNLFETLLPSEESGSFGSGPSAGVWRSMAADQFAGVYADAGGIGIAKMLSAGGTPAEPLRAVEWPYFQVGSIRSFAG